MKTYGDNTTSSGVTHVPDFQWWDRRTVQGRYDLPVHRRVLWRSCGSAHAEPRP